jgi:nucleoside-diphosphate-sugar epimerase
MALRRIYLTGGNGRLGKAVLSRVEAIPLVRKPSGLKGEIVTDFSTDQLRGILKDAKAVIHLAGIISARDRKEFHDVNAGLTWRVVDSMPSGCRMVLASSIAVYGKRPKKLPADEQTRTAPDSDYARSKLEAERIVSRLPDHVILRIGTIYGPGFEDYKRVLGLIRKGKMDIIGNGNNRLPFVHVDDVAAVIASAVEKGRGIYVVAGEPLRQKKVYEIAASALGVSPPRRSVPVIIALLMARAYELSSGFRKKKPPFTAEHVMVLSSDREFDCAKARKELGFSPRPLEQGIIEMAKEA